MKYDFQPKYFKIGTSNMILPILTNKCIYFIITNSFPDQLFILFMFLNIWTYNETDSFFLFIYLKVRCSLEDVADNLVSSQLARGEKEAQVVRSLCSTLSNTGSSPEIVATTMMSSLKRALQEEEPVLMKDIGRTMHEQGTESKILLHKLWKFT